jgi:hypothetical protein
MPYDALKAPDPQDWFELDEQERIDQVIEHHRRHHLPMGECAKLHGVAHVIVENQIALGDPPAVREALARLIGEGFVRAQAFGFEAPRTRRRSMLWPSSRARSSRFRSASKNPTSDHKGCAPWIPLARDSQHAWREKLEAGRTRLPAQAQDALATVIERAKTSRRIRQGARRP